MQLPDGWKEVTIKSCLEKVIDYRGKAPPKAESGIRLITARNIRSGYLDLSHAEFIREDLYEKWMNRGRPHEGDILFTTEAPLGNACMYPKLGMFAVGQRALTLRTDSAVLNSIFFLNYLLSPQGQYSIHRVSSGSTATGIKSKEFVKIRIPLPPIKEQKKIARILATWDRAIEVAEQRITNAQSQKKALMQNLLTGRKRFKEFEGEEWQAVKIEDVAVCLDNKRVPLNSEERSKRRGDVPYWGANGVLDHVNDFIFNEPLVLLAEDGGYFDEFSSRHFIARQRFQHCLQTQYF